MPNVGCPISRKMINERVAQLVALQVTILSLSLFIFPFWYISAFLVLDFFLRGFCGKTSLLKIIAMGLHNVLHLKGKKVNAGPKIFAMKIGFWVSLLITILFYFQFNTTANIVTGILILAAGAEAFFNFCLGCKVFPYWHKAKGKLKL